MKRLPMRDSHKAVDVLWLGGVFDAKAIAAAMLLPKATVFGGCLTVHR